MEGAQRCECAVALTGPGRTRHTADHTRSVQPRSWRLSRHDRDRAGRPEHRATARAGRAAHRGGWAATTATTAAAATTAATATAATTAAAAAAAGCELRAQLYGADVQLRWERLDGTADGDVRLDLGRRYTLGVRQDGITHVRCGRDLQRDPHGHGCWRDRLEDTTGHGLGTAAATTTAATATAAATAAAAAAARDAAGVYG